MAAPGSLCANLSNVSGDVSTERHMLQVAVLTHGTHAVVDPSFAHPSLP